jgi:hypothetical protein
LRRRLQLRLRKLLQVVWRTISLMQIDCGSGCLL